MRVKAICPIHGDECTCEYDISIELVHKNGKSTHSFEISGTCDNCAGEGRVTPCTFREVEG